LWYYIITGRDKSHPERKGGNPMKNYELEALLTEEELDALLEDDYFLEALEEMAAEWETMEMYEKGLATW